MDAWGIVEALGRRWKVFVALLLLTGGAVIVLVDTSSGDVYEVEGSVIVGAPAGASAGLNEYATDAGPQILQVAVNGRVVRTELAARGVDPNYEVFVVSRTPVITFQTSGRSEGQALDSAAAIEEQMRVILATSQNQLGIPEKDQVSLRVIDPPEVALKTSGSVRVLAIPLFLALVFSVIVTVALDQYMLSRSRSADGSPISAQESTPKTVSAASSSDLESGATSP